MPRNGAGTYNLPAGNPVVTGTTISSTWANTTLSDMATALTNSISKDGQTTPTANLPMGGFRLTGLGAGSALGQSLRYEQLFSQGVQLDIASAATVDIGAQYSIFLRITGTTTITSFGTNYNGPRFIQFDDALTLTDSANLVLPGGGNILTAAGDCCIVIPKATAGTPDGWIVAVYQQTTGVYLTTSDIGVTVQAYDADTAKTDVTQTFTLPQRGTITTDNDLSFDLNATNFFKCTPTGGGALTFTNISSGQTGVILLVNGSNYAITAAANTKVGSTTLSTISSSGTYLLSYFSDGTNVYVVNSGALS